MYFFPVESNFFPIVLQRMLIRSINKPLNINRGNVIFY